MNYILLQNFLARQCVSGLEEHRGEGCEHLSVPPSDFTCGHALKSLLLLLMKSSEHIQIYKKFFLVMLNLLTVITILWVFFLDSSC